MIMMLVRIITALTLNMTIYTRYPADLFMEPYNNLI